MSPAGSRPAAKGRTEYFTGDVRVDPLFAAKDKAPFSGAYATFEVGARSMWHTHPAGQHLIVTSGVAPDTKTAGMRKRIGCFAVAFALVLALSPVSGQEASTKKIRLTFDGTAVGATLLDNATARDLLSLLPITLTLKDYDSTEKIHREDRVPAKDAMGALLEAAVLQADDVARRQLLTFVIAGGGFAGVETTGLSTTSYVKRHRIIPQ